MTDNLPDYTAIEPPTETSPAEYTHHERRAELLQLMERAGGPYAVNLAQLSDRYDVHRSTLTRDRQRLKESIGDRLGDDAKLEKRTLYRHVVRDLLDADDWRATKAAWDVKEDYDDWLAEIGEQHREPDRSELDVDIDSRHSEMGYTIVREGRRRAAADDRRPRRRRACRLRGARLHRLAVRIGDRDRRRAPAE